MAVLAPLIPYIMAAGAAYSAYSSYQQGQAQKEQYKAQADANAYNEAALKQRADQTISAANQREEQARVQNRIERGKRLAYIGASGTGYEGSNADVERQNDMLGEIDALNIRYQGRLEAEGLLSQAGLESSHRGMNLQSASTASRMGYVSAAGQFLSSRFVSEYGKGGGIKLTPEDG